jgi:hypothetical protein
MCRIPVISDMDCEGLLVELGVPVVKGFPVPCTIVMDREGLIRSTIFSAPLTGTQYGYFWGQVFTVRYTFMSEKKATTFSQMSPYIVKKCICI